MGSDNDYVFENDSQYNYESNISMNLEINKTCYSKDETIQGSLFLFLKYGSNSFQIINPYAEITILEDHYYKYKESRYNTFKKEYEYLTREEKEKIILLSENFPFQCNMNLFIPKEGLKIPFEIKIPQNAYPSCIFDSDSYVKHFLIINFPSISAKKTLPIIIKNNFYFSTYNGLLKSPVIIQNEISKHKYIFFNSGSFKFSILLPKNIFSYDEVIPFLIDIESPNLSFSIKGIKVSLYRVYKKNYQNNHKLKRSSSEKELINKYISLINLEKILHIEDNIKLPTSPEELNPKAVYTLLDNERRNYKYKEKFKDIKLFPACYGGLLSCDYFIKFIFDMDAWATTNEEFKIQLDLYERFTDLYDTPTNKKTFELNPYENTINTNQQEQNNTNDDNDIDDDLPDEDEIYKRKDNIEEYKKPDNDNNHGGDAPPPSF